MQMSAILLQAVDRLVLRGLPTGQGAQIRISGYIDGMTSEVDVFLDAWPLRIQIGKYTFRLVSVQNRKEDQEAIYRK